MFATSHKPQRPPRDGPNYGEAVSSKKGLSVPLLRSRSEANGVPESELSVITFRHEENDSDLEA